jgi:adenine-specific DNA-methyltransferase
LFYARNKEQLETIFVPNDADSIDRYYKLKDEKFEVRGPYRTHPLEATKSMGDRPNLVFNISAPDGSEVSPKRQWLWSKDRVEKALANNELEFVRGKEGWTVHTKQYLRDEDGTIRQSKAFSIIDNVFTQHGTNEIISLFDEAQVFSFPKPTNLIKPLLRISTAPSENDIVLDFFAGSGTTAQAVMELNAEDGGNRTFILAQLPEPTGREDFPTIADITRERVRRAAQKLNTAEQGRLPYATRHDRGFKALTLDESNFKVWDAEAANGDGDKLAEQLRLYAEHRVPGRSAQDVLYELLLKSGRSLTAPIAERQIAGQTVYDVDGGQMLICLEDLISEDTLRGMIALQPERALCLDAAFNGNDQLKTNIVLQMRAAAIEFRTV